MIDPKDYAAYADEIELHLEDLVPRARAVIRQLRACKTLGTEDPELVAQRARTLAESIDRAERRIALEVRGRQEAALAAKRSALD